MHLSLNMHHLRITIITCTVMLCLINSLSAQLAEPKEKQDKWGFVVDRSVVIEYKYDSVGYKRFGHYTVREGGKWGLVDSLGVEAIACVYDTIMFTKKHGCIVSSNGKYGVVSPTNSFLIPFEYEDIDYYNPDSVSLVKKDGRWGYLRGDKLDFEAERLIFDSPETMAMFKRVGSYDKKPVEPRKYAEAQLLNFVYLNVRYPADARENEIQGTVIIEFLISPDGRVTDPKIIRDVGGGCGEEALRVVKLMPVWVPAMQDGSNVWSRFILPINFKLS